MKKIIAALLVFCLISCQTAPAVVQTTQPAEKPSVAQKALECGAAETIKITVKSPSGEDLVLSKEQFLSIYRLAEKYVALKDSIKNATVQKNITIVPVDQDTYNVLLKLNEEITLTAVVHVNNEELYKLRSKMKRLTTAEPQVQVKEIKRGKKFEITMSIDEVKWTGEFDADTVGGWSWTSYFAGFSTPLLIAVLIFIFK